METWCRRRGRYVWAHLLQCSQDRLRTFSLSFDFFIQKFFVVFLVFFKKQLFPLATIKRQLIYLQIQWQVTLLANNVMDIFDSTHSLLCFRRQLQKLVLVFVKKSGLVYLCLFLYNIHSSANFLVVQSELGDNNNTHFFFICRSYEFRKLFTVLAQGLCPAEWLTSSNFYWKK